MKTKQSGFTLIELMVTVAVAVIALAIGIPWFDNMIANNRAVSQSNALVTAINLAKSEAVTKNVTAVVCADDDTDSSTQVCGDQNDWANGWFVFEDDDSDGVRDGTERVIKIWENLQGGTVVTADVGVLTFNSLGENDSGAVDFDLNPSNTTGNQRRCISVTAVGQINTERLINGCP